METLLGIIENNFVLLQSAGIIGGFVFTSWSLRIDARVRRVQNLFTITAHHREIWSEVYKNPELKRIVDPKADLEKRPITIPERLFTRSLFLHLSAAFKSSKTSMFSEPDELQRDIRNFLRLPIPKHVWNLTKKNYDHEFASFITGQTE
jgi:hypothetical protein